LPRLCGFPLPDLGDRRLNRPAESSLRVRLPLESYPANSSRLAAACRLLSWTFVPFSTSRLGSPLLAGFPGPATFRLRGLVTLLTAYSFRARVGSVSPRRRSWDFTPRSFPLSKGSPARLRSGGTHVPFLLPVSLAPKHQPVPESRGSWALTLPRVPCDTSMWLTRRIAGCSLGFSPFQGTQARALPEIPLGFLSRA
jgi:hypothetical protein